MYDNIEQMNAMAQQAANRLQAQQAEDNNEVDSNEDLYANFRQYGDEKAQSVEYNQEEVNYEDEVYPEYNTPGLEEGYYPNDELPQLAAYDEPLFPGGPGKTQIQAWKKEWEGYDIYVIEVLTDKFIFRTLNRFEYKHLISLSNTDALQREEIICQTVTLWPQGYNWEGMASAKAGVPSTYSDIIMEKSGFTKDYAVQII